MKITYYTNDDDDGKIEIFKVDESIDYCGDIVFLVTNGHNEVYAESKLDLDTAKLFHSDLGKLINEMETTE
jgi:hypothetical protein